jgi:small subunit ribosomal protein S7e
LLQASATELKADLHDLNISAARELEIDGGKKAIIIYVPFRQLRDFHKIQPRLVRELEKKFRSVDFFVCGLRTG